MTVTSELNRLQSIAFDTAKTPSQETLDDIVLMWTKLVISKHSF